MKKTTVAFLVTALTSGMVSASEWGYKGDHGPEHWGEFASECAVGKNQSPINIESGVEAKLSKLHVDYKGNVVGLMNNGHTLQAVVDGKNTFTIDGKEFKLAQFHFHTPSENLIKDKQYPLEAHFVNADKDGNLAVLAVMFETGKVSAELDKLTEIMPNKDQTVTLKSSFAVKDLLPETGEYYRFNGSLTTPPCSEGVRWFVLKDAQSLTSEQQQQLVNVMGQNNRPVQAKNARIVLVND
ncbi:carbonic anhydrase [Vibrio sp. TRT 17S01]|uniref:carbonic anhydrase n=1 Tax=Vibrio sp. TRT 17S01 TaxID=3418505 RepID=UPI003CE90BF6